MKKLLEIFSDIFLFSILLLIFLMPLLVSFNLDPKLYIPKSAEVAGATDIGISDEITFNFEENFSKSDRVTVLESSFQKNLYHIKFQLEEGGAVDEIFRIGTLANQGSNTTRFTLNIFGDSEDLESIRITTRMGNEEYVLFNGEFFEQLEFKLDPQAQEDVEIHLSSDFPINYAVEIRFELRGINAE